LEDEVAEAAQEIIRETCKELGIEVIDRAVNVDHVHLFIKTLLEKAFTEKLRAHKTWYTSLYNKLFGENHQK